MDRPRAAVIAAFDDDAPFAKSLVEATVAGLENGFNVEVLDLSASGFVPAMTRAERLAYHGEAPVVDAMVGEHTRTVLASSALVFVFPTRWWGPAALLKGWLDRVLLPGVAFEFDEDHKVVPALAVDAIAGVTTYDMSAWDVHRVGDGSRRMLLRAVRANAPLRTRTAWLGMYREPSASADRRSRFLERVQRRMARL